MGTRALNLGRVGTMRYYTYVSCFEDMLNYVKTDALGRELANDSVIDPRSEGVSWPLDTTLAGDQHAVLTFQDCIVPASQMLGEPHCGWPAARAMFERAVVLKTAMMVGATRKAVERAVDYAKERVVFDQPIRAFQAIQHLCANMITWVDGAELLVHEALWKFALGQHASTEIAVAKALANEHCQAALREANQIDVAHG